MVDESRVSARDLGNNYMVDLESLGAPKAKVVCAFLNELNEAVAEFSVCHFAVLVEDLPAKKSLRDHHLFPIAFK